MATGDGRIQRRAARSGVSLYPHPIPQLSSRRCSWRNAPARTSLPMTITARSPEATWGVVALRQGAGDGDPAAFVPIITTLLSSETPRGYLGPLRHPLAHE